MSKPEANESYNLLKENLITSISKDTQKESDYSNLDDCLVNPKYKLSSRNSEIHGYIFTPSSSKVAQKLDFDGMHSEAKAIPQSLIQSKSEPKTGIHDSTRKKAKDHKTKLKKTEHLSKKLVDVKNTTAETLQNKKMNRKMCSTGSKFKTDFTPGALGVKGLQSSAKQPKTKASEIASDKLTSHTARSQKPAKGSLK